VNGAWWGEKVLLALCDCKFIESLRTSSIGTSSELKDDCAGGTGSNICKFYSILQLYVLIKLELTDSAFRTSALCFPFCSFLVFFCAANNFLLENAAASYRL
jgi:hypothetical protein